MWGNFKTGPRTLVFWSIILSSVFVYHWAEGWNEPQILTEGIDVTATAAAEATESTVGEEEKIDAGDSDFRFGKKRSWQPPNFAGQEGALGWSPEAFAVPHGMEERVRFWVRIYTQLTTKQGLIHDSTHPTIVYESLDFSDIERNSALSEKQIRKAKKTRIEDKKKEIRERLLRLAQVKDAADLTGEDLRLWNLFSAFDEPNKFKEATHKKRIRFQLGQSDRFLQGIYYSGRYLKQMEEIFRERGLPIELTRLPFVESSFNIKARSRVGASGIWQFMRYTGRRFMRIHFASDERNDPIRATESAARLFRMNFDMLKAWPLAVTGYNHGPAGVQRIVKRFQSDNIADLVDERHGRFGFASANFYASFLAAIEVEKNATKYFGSQVYWDEPYVGKEIKLSRSVNKKLIERWFGGDRERAQEFNPHLSRTFWQGYAQIGPKDFVRVPDDIYDLAMNELRALSAPGLKVVDRDVAADIQYYSIGVGETLSDIALQMGVSVQAIKELNGIDNPRHIRAGQKLMLPTKK